MLDLDPISWLMKTPAILIAFSFHEFAHAWVADRSGDNTPRYQGRLTLSPKTHIDPLGFILFLVSWIGWAKPVQTNPRNFRHPRRDMALVSIAGPAANLLIAIAFALIIKVFEIMNVFDFFDQKTAITLYQLLWITIRLNMILFVFNLLPIPPLDGFNILANVVPFKNYKVINFLYQYGFVILLIVIFTPLNRIILWPIFDFVFFIFRMISGIPL